MYFSTQYQRRILISIFLREGGDLIKMGSGRTNVGNAFARIDYAITDTGSPLQTTSAASLSLARQFLAGASVGSSFALFAGGETAGLSPSAAVDAYNRDLVRTTPTALSVARSSLCGASVGSTFALFAGGIQSGFSNSSVVDAYDTSLVRSTPTALSAARHSLASAVIGSFTLFAGGSSSGAYSSAVDAYDTSLVRTTPTALSVARDSLAGASNSSYAVFAGGNASGGVSNVIDAYNSSLVRSSPNVLSVARSSLSGASLDTRAIFAGGNTSGGTGSNVIDAFTTSMARTTSVLNASRYDFLVSGNCAIGRSAIFAGGQTSNPFQTSTAVEVVDTSLGATYQRGLSEGRYRHAVASVAGLWLLFAGGLTNVPSVGLLSSVHAVAYGMRLSLPAGSKYKFLPATSETTVGTQTVITIPAPAIGYIKFKRGTVTSI